MPRPPWSKAASACRSSWPRLKHLAVEAKLHNPFELFDFGVRRRFSGAWQREVVQAFAQETAQWFKGTSNVLLARDLNLVPIGTMAHGICRPIKPWACACATSR